MSDPHVGSLNISTGLWLLLECQYHCSLVRIHRRPRRSLLAWAIGRKSEGLETKKKETTTQQCSIFLHATSCSTCTPTRRACLLNQLPSTPSLNLCEHLLSLTPLRRLSLLTFCCPAPGFSLLCLFDSILCQLPSGKEASNHTLRPGGPPPIPKSPSKVRNSCLFI